MRCSHLEDSLQGLDISDGHQVSAPGVTPGQGERSAGLVLVVESQVAATGGQETTVRTGDSWGTAQPTPHLHHSLSLSLSVITTQAVRQGSEVTWLGQLSLTLWSPADRPLHFRLTHCRGGTEGEIHNCPV